MAMLKKREDLTDTKDNNTMFALGLSDSFGDFLLIKEEEQDDIDLKIEEVKKMNLDAETESKVINEYNNLRNSKSFKEKAKYENNIRKLLKN